MANEQNNLVVQVNEKEVVNGGKYAYWGFYDPTNYSETI